MKVLTPSYYSRKWANKRVTQRYRGSSHHFATPPPQTTTTSDSDSPPSSSSSSSSPSSPPTLSSSCSSSSPPASPIPTTYKSEQPDVLDESGVRAEDASSWPLDSQKPVLPPGTFIGENLALRHREGYQFTLNRVQRHLSHVFTTHLYGEPCIVIAGADEARLFYDNEHMSRADAFPKYLRKAMHGTGTVMGMDGPEHRQRKAAILSALTDGHLDAHMRVWGRLLDRYVDRWAALEHFSFGHQLHHLFAEFALAAVLGAIDVEQRQLAKLTRKMVRVVKTSEGLPLNVPGMGLWRSNKARRALERYALDCVRRERHGCGAPASPEAAVAAADEEDEREETERIQEMSALRTMAHVTDEATGELLPEEVVASELTNMLVHTLGNSFVAIWLIHAFHENPHVYNSLQAEVEFVNRSHSTKNYHGRASFLDRLHYTECVVREVKRYYPLVPFIAARVTKSFDYSGHLFPEGWLVLLGIPAIHLDGRVYRDPSAFNPARFEEEEHKLFDERYTSVLHGGGDDVETSHRCPGERLSMLLLKSLAARLAKDCTWHWVTPQILSYSLLHTPPSPFEGMRVDSFTKTAGEGVEDDNKTPFDAPQEPIVIGSDPNEVGQNEVKATTTTTVDDLNGINNSNSAGGLPAAEVGDTEGPDSAAAMKRRLRRAQTDSLLGASGGPALCPFGYGRAPPTASLNQ